MSFVLYALFDFVLLIFREFFPDLCTVVDSIQYKDVSNPVALVAVYQLYVGMTFISLVWLLHDVLVYVWYL